MLNPRAGKKLICIKSENKTYSPKVGEIYTLQKFNFRKGYYVRGYVAAADTYLRLDYVKELYISWPDEIERKRLRKESNAKRKKRSDG